MLSENRKTIEIFYIISFIILAVGSLSGSLYFKYNFEGTDEVKQYMTEYVASLRAGMNYKTIINASIKNYTFLIGIIAFGAFFKFGPLLSSAALLRKAFVNAFTVSAMFDVYSLKGIILSAVLLPQIILIFPLAALLNSVCITYSGKRALFEKKDKIIYIIFLIIIFTIFCISAVCEGLLTTTFMKWAANKVT